MKSSGTLFYDYHARISEEDVAANGIRKTKIRNEAIKELGRWEDGVEKRISSETSLLCIVGIKIERSFTVHVRMLCIFPSSRISLFLLIFYAVCASLFPFPIRSFCLSCRTRRQYRENRCNKHQRFSYIIHRTAND